MVTLLLQLVVTVTPTAGVSPGLAVTLMLAALFKQASLPATDTCTEFAGMTGVLGTTSIVTELCFPKQLGCVACDPASLFEQLTQAVFVMIVVSATGLTVNRKVIVLV